MRLGIDASNLRRGGGITHLCEILRAGDPATFGFSEVVIWSGRATLEALPPSNDWLRLEHRTALDRGLARRTWWQNVSLAREALRRECDLLFIPGGSYAGTFRPFVTMSRNMLPFEPAERARYGMSAMRVKLTLLEYVQAASMRRADGVIFLSRYARERVATRTGTLSGKWATIPHGVDGQFRVAPRPQRPLDSYDRERPFRFLYVSIIDVYKHQQEVAEAVARLRSGGVPVAIDFVGPEYAPAARNLREAVARLDPHNKFIRLAGAATYSALPALYSAADAFVFASSCENMPNILLEAMAAGLPIASSNRGPMPEILGNVGAYFDPDSIEEITAALGRIAHDPVYRERSAAAAYGRAAQFSWRRCAEDTYHFLADVAATARCGG